MAVSRYRMGWLLVLFDLPVTDEKERKLATKFRNDMLDMGYLMLQYSVYAKCAVTLERKASMIREIKRISPKTGSIQCFFLTDTQWGQSVIICDKGKSRYKIDRTENNPDQLKFW